MVTVVSSRSLNAKFPNGFYGRCWASISRCSRCSMLVAICSMTGDTPTPLMASSQLLYVDTMIDGFYAYIIFGTQPLAALSQPAAALGQPAAAPSTQPLATLSLPSEPLSPKMSGSVYIYVYICAISDLLSAIMYLYIYIYMTRAQPSANYILVVVVVCADVNAMGRPTFSSMCDIPAAVG